MPNGEGNSNNARPSPGLWRDLGWLALAVVITYASAVPGGFVWLDTSDIGHGGYRIVQSEDWGSLWTTSVEQYRGIRFGAPEERGPYWRPVYALSISLDWMLWGDRPWCYHVENIVWHLLVVAGLYVLGTRLFGSLPEGRRIIFWATLLFAVHPLGVHSVTWISGRPSLLCAAFSVAALLALGQVAADAQVAERNRSRRALWLMLAGACLLLAVGSEELGMVLPLVATVLFWPPLRAPADPQLRRLRGVRLAGLATLWACALAVFVYRAAVVGAWGIAGQYPTDSWWQNAAMSARLWWHYVACVLTPFQFNLSDAWPVVQSVGLVDIVAMLAVVALLITLVIGGYQRWPFVPALSWYILWTLPASGILPLQHFRAERSLYPASWGLLVAVVMLFLASASPAESKLARRAPAAILSVIAVWLMLTTALANMWWWNEAVLFSRSVKQDPHYLEGRMVLAENALAQGDYMQCAEQTQLILADVENETFVAYSDPYRAYSYLGMALLRLGENEQALSALQNALRYRPTSARELYNAGLASQSMGDLHAARQFYEKSLESEPRNSICRYNLGVTLLRLNKPEACVELLTEYVEAHPNDLGNMRNLTAALLALRRFQEAASYLEVIVREEPKYVVGRAQLAWCQWEMGQRDEARRNFEQAKEEAPDNPVVMQIEKLLVEDEQQPAEETQQSEDETQQPAEEKLQPEHETQQPENEAAED